MQFTTVQISIQLETPTQEDTGTTSMLLQLEGKGYY